MLIYASGHSQMNQETLVGQVNLPLGGLMPTVGGKSETELHVPICAANLEIGQAAVELAYYQR